MNRIEAGSCLVLTNEDGTKKEFEVLCVIQNRVTLKDRLLGTETVYTHMNECIATSEQDFINEIRTWVLKGGYPLEVITFVNSVTTSGKFDG